MNAGKSKMDTEFKVQIARNVRHTMREMHYHDFYEIYIQNQGEREHLINGCLHCLKPGDVMLLKPYLLHQSVGNASHTRSLVYFTENFLRQYFSQEMCEQFLSVFQYGFLSLSAKNYQRITQLTQEMEKEDYYDSQNLLFVKLAELLMILLETVPETSSTKCREWPDTAVSSHSPLITYIHENYLTLSGIDEIANTFYITPSHLCRTFKKLTGYTVIQYINILKLQYACQLLRETEKTVTEIALECGFHSAMYFCRIFKDLMNLTPTEYRKM